MSNRLVNPYDFGAIGDGTADDRQAIASALTALGSEPGTIVFPAGIFRIGSDLTFSANVHLTFDNGGQLKPDNSVAITVAGRVTASPRSQIFANATAGQGSVNLKVQDVVWAHWFGAKADSDTLGGGTADDPAIQAAINSVSLQVSPGYVTPPTGAGGGSSVLLAPGNYRISTYLVIGAGIQFGGTGGTVFGSTTLYFDANAGRNDGNDYGCLILERKATTPIQFGRSDGCRVHDLVLYGNPDGRYALLGKGQTYLERRTAIKVYSPVSVLENIYVFGFSGHGIVLAGDSLPNHVADGISFVGNIWANNCGGYGILVHGGDSNANNFSGACINVTSNASWGVYDGSFLGNGWGTIHAEANGVWPYPPNAPTTWLGGDIDLTAKMWSADRSSILGELVLPTIAYLAAHPTSSRFQWRVSTVGNPATFAGAEPNWASVTTLGSTTADANGNVFIAWQEEGGPYYRPAIKTGGVSSINFLYCETNQQPPQLFNSTLLGANSDMRPECAPGIGDATPRDGLAFGRGIRRDFYTLQDTGPSPARNPSTPLLIRVGGTTNDAKLALSYSANPSVPGTPPDGTPAGWHHDYPGGDVQYRWRPDILRWQTRYSVYNVWTSYTTTGGKVLPFPGAICFPHLWIGGNDINGATLGMESRITAVYPQNSTAMPTLSTSALAPGGAFQPGDLVLNLTRNPGQLDLYPVAWRPTKKTVATATSAHSVNTNFPAGTVIKPGGAAGDTCYRARNGGKTAASGTSFTGSTPVIDGAVTWDAWGKENDSTAWDPVIAESPTMLEKSVAGGSAVVLTANEAAHQRIRFTGTLTANIEVIVPAGPAAGWLRLFNNETFGPFSLTIVRVAAGAGVTVPQGASQMLWCDGVDVIAAAPSI